MSIVRIGWAVATLAAVIATYAEAAGRGPVNPFNFFGYFTIQSNLLAILVFAAVGAVALRSTAALPAWTVGARALLTVYMVIVGVVYNVLLAPIHAEGGVEVPWANWVMHVGGPLLVAIDWVFAPDWARLPRRTIGYALIYPLVWVGVVLVRGATDGWVPYPFLNPSQGYGVVWLYVLGIAVAFALVAWLVVAWSRRGSRAAAK